MELTVVVTAGKAFCREVVEDFEFVGLILFLLVGTWEGWRGIEVGKGANKE